MIWTGRFDGDSPLYHRIFQHVIVEKSYENIQENDFVLHGFEVDEGTRRNKGRVGSKDAPDVIRKNMGNFPVVKPDFVLRDLGDISCEKDDLEKAQQHLAEASAKVFFKGAKSIVLGGGHEVAFAHYSGIRKAFPKKKIGIINIDSHFDNREPENGLSTSGTAFYQIPQDKNTSALHIGIQRNSNTLKLFDTAHQFGMRYILSEEIFFENLPKIYQEIDQLTENTDVVYLTICMDVFNASIAPGVSAPAYNGIFADAAFMHFFKKILRSEKLVALDVAEVNPMYDLEERTARLAASLVNEWLMM